MPAVSLAVVALGGSARLYANGQRIAQGVIDLSASGSVQLGSANFAGQRATASEGDPGADPFLLVGTLGPVRWFTRAIDNLDICAALDLAAAACPVTTTDPCRCPVDHPVRRLATPDRCGNRLDDTGPSIPRVSASQYTAAFLNDDNASSMFAVDNVANEVVITVDLLGLHEFFRFQADFLSARPHSMVIERSRDHGVSFQPYEYISQDCQGVYQQPTRTAQDLVSADDVLCRQGGTGPGSVSFALFFSDSGAEALTRRNGDVNFALSLATHLRLRLTRADTMHGGWDLTLVTVVPVVPVNSRWWCGGGVSAHFLTPAVCLQSLEISTPSTACRFKAECPVMGMRR